MNLGVGYVLQMASAAQAFFAVWQSDAKSVIRELFDHCRLTVPASGFWVLQPDDFLFFNNLGIAAAEVISIHVFFVFVVPGCWVDGT